MTAASPSAFGRFRSLLGGGSEGTVASRAAALSGDELKQAVLLLQDYEASGLGWFWASNSDDGRNSSEGSANAACCSIM